MVRAYQNQGEVMVRLKMGSHLSGLPEFSTAMIADFALAQEDVTFYPKYAHRELVPDDFMPGTPAEMLSSLVEATIVMNLLHYDRALLEMCRAEATGGALPISGSYMDGESQSVQTLGRNRPLYASGCHYVGVGLTASRPGSQPWRFPSCYLMEQAAMPQGVSILPTQVSFRAIPYRWYYGRGSGAVSGAVSNPTSGVFSASGEIAVSGVKVWERQLLV